MRPLPWQLGQVRSTVKKPDWVRIRPRPPQVVRVTGAAPFSAPLPPHSSQTTLVGTRISASLPVKASSRAISMLKRRSAP